METIVINFVVAAIQAGVKMAAEAGVTVDLDKVMATALVRAGGSMPEYNQQLAAQKNIFPDG